jgi:hypothetical protein
MSAHLYVRNAVNNVREMLQSEGFDLKMTAKTPFPSNYRPELDVTDELDADLCSRYSQLIGVLRWMVESGQIDIYYEVSVLSQYLASPRVGHLETVYHIFAYLHKHDKSSIVFDPSDPGFDPNDFIEEDWSEFYSVFVDANHAGNVVTHHSYTGIVIFLQNTPIIWHSRRQNTVETSTFGSEFVALRNARDLIVG